MPAKVYTDKDADLTVLKDKTLVVLGFGSQGHAHALNLKNSGLRVIVGLYEGSKSIPVAKEKGFEVVLTAEAVRRGDVIFVALPDTKQPAAYVKDIAPNLTKGKTLLFSHGFSIHFKTIVPPKNVGVILVAPKGPGHIVRRQYTEGKGVPALIAVYQNPSKQAKKIALAWAKGIGATRAGVIETTFKEETETDLFGEQAVLCGGLTSLALAGYETLVEAGYQPEMAYFECLHELKLIVDLMNESGISGMRFSVSETAKWGDVSVGPKIIDAGVKKRMKKALKEVQSGKFAKGWIREYQTGYQRYQALLKTGEKHSIEKVGARLRSLMPWMKKHSVKGVQAAY
ncbi:MAG: ketol-acid reductoisomerase [Verrucomicrobia bacterium]|nr:MAG: ketol-acid reductoisomerase [Verrucomicrobiota bacterium]